MRTFTRSLFVLLIAALAVGKLSSQAVDPHPAAR